MRLAGNKVVVVGGSSGIGLSTAELAKSEGADVVIASHAQITEWISCTKVDVHRAAQSTASGQFDAEGTTDTTACPIASCQLLRSEYDLTFIV